MKNNLWQRGQTKLIKSPRAYAQKQKSTPTRSNAIHERAGMGQTRNTAKKPQTNNAVESQHNTRLFQSFRHA
jgi:hypothetical protein